MSEYNDWGVSYSAISFAERALKSHSKVKRFERSDDIRFDITRTDGHKLRMVLVDEYTLGLAAVHRALAGFSGVEYVVTCSNWNGYTREAKEYGHENGIGIFILTEFLGAINWSNPKKYVQKDEDGNPIYNYHVA